MLKPAYVHQPPKGFLSLAYKMQVQLEHSCRWMSSSPAGVRMNTDEEKGRTREA